MLGATYMLLLITREQDFMPYLQELLLNVFYITCHIVGKREEGIE
jgi:hypothetical protein